MPGRPAVIRYPQSAAQPSRRGKCLAAILAGIALGGIIAGVHHWLGRADRIAAEAARVNLLTVRDQIIQYEYQTGKLPEHLGVLVPRQLRWNQILDQQGHIFRYDPQRRWLEEAAPHRVRGLISYQLPPHGIDLPAPERPSQPATVLPPKTKTVEAPAPSASRKLEAAVEPIVIGKRPGAEIILPETAARMTDLTSLLQIPTGPKLPEAPPGSLVFEAEHYSETNYGWEVMPDADSAGGAVLNCKDGIANVAAQTVFHVGNFYDLRSSPALTFLRTHFHLPQSGTYFIYGRMWTTDTLCSNFVSAAIDTGGPRIGGMGNRTPFRWVWCELKDNPFRLSAGDHFLHLFIHEDGVKIDQFILSPEPISGGQAFQANFKPCAGTAWSKQAPAAHLMFEYKNRIFSERTPPAVNLTLRRLRAATGTAVLHVVLEGAAPERNDVVLHEGEIDLAKLPELSQLPVSFEKIDLRRLLCREYRLHAVLKNNEDIIAEAEVPLMKPFVWEVFGPLNFMPLHQQWTLDGDGQLPAKDARTWKPFEDSSYQLFGVMDFGLHCYDNTMHPEHDAAVYARTEICVPETGDYLFKIQSDDQMLLWLDGKEIFRFTQTLPVTRTAERITIRLTKGMHRLRMRVNQFKGRWQASLRIRTLEDGISLVTGVTDDE